jgi:hypothetical protein
MGKHEVFGSITLSHRTKIVSETLPVKDRCRETATAVGTEDWMHRRMHDDVGSFG